MMRLIIFLFSHLAIIPCIRVVAVANSAVTQDTSTHQKFHYGVASYYADKFEGKRTANGEIFTQKKMTAAHNSLPLGTYIKVTNLRNQKTVKVKINDRLHHRNKRVVDLSKAAAQKLGFIRAGITRVKIQVID